jgi:O-antigen/teichoic acid export membrane protein
VEASHGEGLKGSVLQADAVSLTLLVPAVLVLLLIGDMLLGHVRGEYVQALGLLQIIALSSFPAAAYSCSCPYRT